MLRTFTRPGTAARYPRATSRGRRVKPGRSGSGLPWLTREGARLVARPDVVFRSGAPARGAARISGDRVGRRLYGRLRLARFLDVHPCAVVTVQSGETLHMGVNATTFAGRQLGQASRTGLPAGMLAAAAQCYRKPATRAPKRRTGPSVLTVHEQQR